MKLHLPTGLRAALIAALATIGFTFSNAWGGASESYTIITFATEGNTSSWADYNIYHSGVPSSPAGGPTAVIDHQALADSGIVYSINLANGGGKIGIDPLNVGGWTNQAALDDMNSAMGTSLTTTELGQCGYLYGWQAGRQTSETFDFTGATGKAQITNGSVVTFYVGISASVGNASGFSITGMSAEDTVITFATETGSGFGSESYSSGGSHLTIVKIEGTVEDAEAMTFTGAGNNKNGISFIMYHAGAPAPVETLTWAGTSGSNGLTSAVWNNGETDTNPYSETAVLVFGSTGNKTVTISGDAISKAMEVQAAGYIFENSGSLTAQKLTVADGASLELKGEGDYIFNRATVTGSGVLSIAEGAAMVLNGTNAQGVMGAPVTGDGILKLTESASIANGFSSAATTALSIEEGATLNLGGSDGGKAEISSFSKVVLNNGDIIFKSQASSIKGLTVESGKAGTFFSSDMDKNVHQFAGATRADGNLTLANYWNAQMNVAALVGDGTFMVTGNANANNVSPQSGSAEGLVFSIEALSTADAAFTGDLIIDHTNNGDTFSVGTGTGDTAFRSLQLNINKTLDFNLGANTSIGSVTIDSGSLNMTGTGNLTLGGLDGAGSFTDAAVITFNVDEATSATYSGTLDINGVVKEGKGSQTLGSFNPTETIAVNAGVLVLNGTYAIDDLTSGMDITYSGAEHEGNGFRTIGGTAIVYTVADGAELSRDSAQFTFGGEVVDVVDGKYQLAEKTDNTTFYVNVDAESSSKALEGAELQHIVLADGTTLNVDQDVTGGFVRVASGAATVNILADKTVNGTMQGATLSGAGTYALDSGTADLGTGIMFGEGWSGTVRISDTTKQDGNTAWIDNLAKDGSWVEFVHFKGYDRAWASTFVPEVAANIILTSDGANAAWELSAFASQTYTMVATGDWKGDGTFLMAGGSATQSQAVEYQGDISEWVGSIEVNSPGMRRVTFSNNATAVNASLVNKGTGAFELVVGNAAAFSKEVNVTKLTVDAEKSATFQANTTVGQLAGTGSIVKTGTDTTMTVTAPTGTGTDAAMLAISVNEGTLKATAANALGSGAITVAENATLDLTNGGALGATQAVANSGNVLLHSTLTQGAVNGGKLTIASDFPSDGEILDVDGTDTGNGFSQGGAVQVYDTEHATLSDDIGIVHGENHYKLTDLTDGAITLSGADWNTYQLNGKAQYAVQDIMDYAIEKGGELKTISVNADKLTIENDSTTLKTSMMGGEHLATFSVYMSGTSNLTIDGDCAVNITANVGADSTITLEKDATIGSLTAADQENMEAIQLTVTGNGHTLKTDGLAVAFDGTLTLDEGVTVEMLPETAFSSISNANMVLKKGAVLVMPEVSFATVEGGDEATVVITSDDYLPMYDARFTEYSITGARITYTTAANFDLGHVIDATSQVVNEGSGSLRDISTNEGYAELNAQGGDIYISTAEDAGTDERALIVSDLTLAEGRTVAGDTGKTVSITVNGTATFGSGTTVGAALTMAGGSTLNGATALASHALSIESGVNIGESLWSTLTALAPEASANIFTGVSALTLAGAGYTDEVDLSTIFTHDALKANRYTLSYDNGNVVITKNLENNRYWKGGDGTWNYSGTVWTDEEGAGTDVPFVSGYNAHFTAANGGTVTLGEDITAASVYVSGADYTFAPNGHTLTVNNAFEVDGRTATLQDLGLSGANLKLTAKNGGTLKIGANSSVKDVEIGSGSAIMADGSTLAVAGSLVNNGSLSADTLTLSQGTAQGGNASVGTLDLADNKSYTFGNLIAAAISGNADLTIGADGSLLTNSSSLKSLSAGAAAQLSGTITVAGNTNADGAVLTGNLTTETLTGGSLSVVGGNLSLTSGGSLGNVQFAGSSSLSASATVTLDGALQNTGDLTLMGRYDASNLPASKSDSKYVEGGISGNGFEQARLTLTIVEGGATYADEAAIVYRGKDLTEKVGTDGRVSFDGDVDYTKYYVNSGSENASTALDNPNQRLGTFELKAGTTLVADRDIDISRVNAEGAATLDIAAGTTVTSAGQSKTLTLKGAGTFALNSGVSTPGVALDSAWAGTVSFTEAALTTLKGSWKSGSTVSLTGVTGSLGDDLIEANVVLNKGTGDWGFGQTATVGTPYTNLEGTLTGDGNLGVKGGSVSSTFNLDGDIDGWTGNFIVATDADTDLNLNGTAKTVHGSVSGSNLTVNVQADTAFEGALNVDVINVDNTKAATLKADSTARWVDAYNGTLKVNDGKTLTVTDTAGPEGLKLGAGASIVLQGTAYLGGEDYGYIGGTVANGTSGEQAVTIDNANITATGTTLRVNGGSGFTVDNKLVNATLAVENGLPSTVTLNNVKDSLDVAGDLEIGPGGSLKVANGGSKQELVIGDGTTLTLANDTTLDANLTLNRGATLKLDYNMGTPVATTLNGGGLTLYKGLTLSGDLYETLKGLSTEGESVTLFSNVGTVVFDGATSPTVDASDYFTNLLDLEGDYTFNYDEGLLSIVYSESSSRQLVWDGTETEHRWVAYEPETIAPEVKDWYQPSTETETHFVQGDTATFGSDAETKVVNLSAGETTAKMVTIKEAADYEFVADAAGSKLSATRFEVKEGATLNKSGTGTLILEVGENVTVDTAGFFVDEGELVIGTAEMPGTLALDNGVMEVAEDATLRVAKIQDSEGSLIAVCGTLNVASGSLHAIHALEGSTLVISNVNGVAAGTLSIDSDTTLHGLENHGTLDVGMHALTLTEAAAQGGNVTAGTLNLAQNGNAFGNLKVNTIHYAYGAEGAGELGAVNVDTIAANGGFPVITLDLADTMGTGGSLAPTQRTGEATTYTLVHADGQTLSTSNFMLGGNTLALLVQNGLIHEGAGLETDGSNITLTVGGQDVTWNTDKDVTEWGYSVMSGDAITHGANTLNGVQRVVVDHSRTVDVSGAGSAPGLRVRNITGPDGRTITFTGTKADTVNLIVTEATSSHVGVNAANITLKVGLDELDEIDPVDYKDLHVGAVNLTGATLDVHDHEGLDDAFSVDSLSGDTNSLIKGRVIVDGQGGAYRGAYENANVILHEDASQALYAGTGLTVGGLGEAKLAYNGPQTHMDAIEGIGMTVVLNDPSQDNSGATLVLDKTSWLVNGRLIAGMSAINSALTLDSGNDVPDLIQAQGLNTDGTTVIINQAAAEDDVMAMEVLDNGKKRNLLLAHLGADNSNTDDVVLNGYLYNKYYENARLEAGRLLVDRRTDFYTADVVQPTTENGRAGAGMLDDALVEINPQVTNPAGDLAAVMTALETGAVANPDRLAAAVSGASAAALGHAFNNDVQRQLRAIRNRTTTMGLPDCTNHEGMPYVNAWANAEGDYRKLDADGTLAGYTLSSWGGTLGCDLDVTNRLTVGAAFTMMRGDFTAHSADEAQGDMNRNYVSLFARYGYRAWVHTFVATFGYADSKIDRTVNYGAGGYTAKDEADGNAFGFLYEVGYTKALNEDASTCLQPVFNVNYRHSSLGSYTEKGAGDAALNVGSADMDALTFGLGARLQSIIGTSVYNRATLFEGRVLAKFDAGDRDCSASSSIIGVNARRSVKSAEMGAFGIEVGAGLTIPVGETGGSLFLDVSGDFRGGYTEVNGAAGYRFSF